MAGHARIRRVLGGPASKRMEIPVTKELLERLGECLVEAFVHEAKKDFAKRGWSGQAPDGSAPIWDSFSYRIRGERTVEVVSTFPDIDVLTSRDIPQRKMTWLTQEAKDRVPSKYPVTPGEARLGMKRGGRVSKGERLPLVIPLKDDSGQVVFRTAPLRTQDAWIHPGIARFTFAQRAARRGREACLKIIREEAVRTLCRSFER